MVTTEIKLLTVADVVEITMSSESTVRRWITEGHLPAAQFPGYGGRVRIHRCDLEEFLKPKME